MIFKRLIQLTLRSLNVSTIVYIIWMKASAPYWEAGPHRPASLWPLTSGGHHWPMLASATLLHWARGWGLTSTMTASLLASTPASSTESPSMTRPSLRFGMSQLNNTNSKPCFYKMSANNEVHPGIKLHYRIQSPGTLLKLSLKVYLEI